MPTIKKQRRVVGHYDNGPFRKTLKKSYLRVQSSSIVSERWKENLLPQVPEQHLSYSPIAQCSFQEKPGERTIQKRLILQDLHKLEKILRELFITRKRYKKAVSKRVGRLVILQKFTCMRQTQEWQDLLQYQECLPIFPSHRERQHTT